AQADGTYRVRFHTGYGLLDEETVPEARLAPYDLDPPLGVAPSPATTADRGCPWGRSRKGCAPSPMPLATVFSLMGGAAAGAAGAAFHYGSRNHDGVG